MSDKPNNNIPTIGTRRYAMAGLSFAINRTPKDVIQEWLFAAIKQLQESGQFDLANKLSQNPQPFFQQPHAMAVFMAASVELDKANARIDKLEGALTGLADVLRSVAREQGASGHSNETFIPAIDKAVAALEAKGGDDAN